MSDPEMERVQMSSDEQELVRRFQCREPGAFDAFYDRYGDPLYRFCYRLCAHAADAEDLAQEVFLAAFQGLDRFTGRSSVATWLFRIAIYRWRRLYGRPGPETISLDEQMPAITADPATAGVERLSLESALAALPDALREAFLLVKAEGLKYREAALVLNVPQGTVQSRVHDAVMRLRGLLAQEEPVSGTSGSFMSESICRGELGHEL
jgi:RNA polymerase sigma-70 factor (ECF subfamily)